MKYPASGLALMHLATPALAQSVEEKTGLNSVLDVAPNTADFVKEATNCNWAVMLEGCNSPSAGCLSYAHIQSAVRPSPHEGF
jgi:hypothetical protein